MKTQYYAYEIRRINRRGWGDGWEREHIDSLVPEGIKHEKQALAGWNHKMDARTEDPINSWRNCALNVSNECLCPSNAGESQSPNKHQQFAPIPLPLINRSKFLGPTKHTQIWTHTTHARTKLYRVLRNYRYTWFCRKLCVYHANFGLHTDFPEICTLQQIVFNKTFW